MNSIKPVDHDYCKLFNVSQFSALFYLFSLIFRTKINQKAFKPGKLLLWVYETQAY